MNAPATTFDLLEFSVRQSLARYRQTRQYRDPFGAAEAERDAAARYLADCVLDQEGESHEFAVESYRVARAIYDAVLERAAVSTVESFADMNRQQQFWQTGKRAAS